MARLATMSLLALTCLAALRADARGQTLVVVNAQGGEDGAKRIEELRPTFEKLGHLVPTADDKRLLESPLPNTGNVTDIKGATALRRQAFERFSSFRYEQARALLDDAESKLLEVADAPLPTKELGEIALLRGQISLQQRKPKEAAGEFRLARKLLGREQLDAGFYSPKVRTAYREAKGGASATIRFEVGVEAEVDGESVSEGAVTVVAGPHYIKRSAANSQTTLARIDVKIGVQEIAGSLVPLSRAEQILTFRRGLATPSRRDKAARSMAAIVGADRLLVLETTETGLGLTLYVASKGRWSKSVEATAEGVRSLFVAPNLTPSVVVKPSSAGSDGPLRKPASEASWGSRNRGKLVIGGAALVLLTVVISIAVVRSESGAAIDSFCIVGATCE